MALDSTSQRLHVAIALTVLSRKPPQQSLSSYLVDLKARFPLTPSNSNLSIPRGSNHRSTLSLEEEDPWRKRALALEEENEILKLRAQKHELEVLALKSAPTPLDDSNADIQVQSSQVPKKKRKILQTTSKSFPDRQDLRTLVNDLRSGPCLPALKDSLDVLTSFRILQLSDTSTVQTGTDHEAILIPNIKRSLLALGKLLNAVLARDASVVATTSRVDIVSCLCNLLLSMLNSTLPLGPRHSILPQILGELTAHIIRPIIQSFHSLSGHEFASGLKGTSQKPAAPDIRPDLLCILKRVFECLRALKARTRDLREFMIFETAKEVETLWKAKASPRTSEREHRIERLTRKDSLWYQCSILHLALDRLPPSRASDTGEVPLLSSAAVQILADLIHHFEGQTPVDEVAKGMVLAVVEKAWLSGLYESSSEGEEGPV